MQLFTKYSHQGLRYTIFMCCLICLVSSCRFHKHLNEDETFLDENEIIFTNKNDVDNWRGLKEDLSTLAYQKPNSKGLNRIRQWLHYKIENPKERKVRRRARIDARRIAKGKEKRKRKLRKWAKESLSEKPSIYNNDLSQKTATEMETYLYERGYFNPRVEFSSKRVKRKKKKKTKVTYQVATNQRYYFDNITYSSRDTAIHSILQKIKKESLIEAEDPVDITLYNAEKRRIINYLRNDGYANFYANYIPILAGDSSNYKVNAEFRVLLTKDSTPHKVYTIGNVYVDLYFKASDTSQIQIDTIINGVNFLTTQNKDYINPKAIAPKIFFKKGDIFNISDIQKTRKQLGILDIFQFVEIKRIPHPELDNVINFEIRLIPKKRMETGSNFQINGSQNIASSRQFIGFSASQNYKNRNIFKGGEVLTARAEFGIEINPEEEDVGNGGETKIKWNRSSSNLNLGSDLFFPKLIDHPLGTTKIIRKFSKSAYTLLEEQANTQTSIDYSFVSAFDRFGTNQYSINIFASSWGYNWRNNKNARFSMNQIGINFLDPKFSQNFRETILKGNQFLANSLSEQLFTGFIVRDFSMFSQSNPNKSKVFSFRGSVEQSGAEIAAINGIYNVISSNIEPDTFRFLSNKFEFSQYLRLELDGRFDWKRPSSKSWAFRTYIGLATPFAFSDNVPYTKQFSVGGPESMRGWRIRELGPGAFQDPDTIANATNTFFQTGDIKLEMNAEYRFPILWYFKGAVFLDVGNVFALQGDGRDDADFGINKFAVNTGLGLRIDFSVFLLRFDFGLKLRNPFPDETGRYWIIRSPSDLIKGENINPNLAIGFPF